jgi:hypothetical protein
MRRILVSVLLLFSVVACGGEEKVSQRPLSNEEASLLSEVQYQNYEIGGADFSVSAAFLGMGETLSMTGFVDWKNHTGRATVSAQGKESGIVEVLWNSNMVLEHHPVISKTLESMGSPGIEYVAREPDTTNRLIDRAISIIISLASKERENALLIQQKEGSVFMRNDSLRQKDVLVMRYGKVLRYWVDPAAVKLLRFEGDSSAGTAPIVVDLLAFGERKVEAPTPQSIVAADNIKELYDASLAS